MKYVSLILASALVLLSSCQRELQVEVEASFTLDHEEYGPMEPVVITNTTQVKNSVIAICKWEWPGNVSYEMEPKDVVFKEVGEYEISLTVTANDGAVKDRCSQIIKVVDNNIKPVADFTWSPTTVKAGDPVTFTDLSTDEDGEIKSWEWKIGGGVRTEQNPVVTIIESGEVEVSLTVTDNRFGTSTKTVVIAVEPGKYNLKLDWLQNYGEAGNFTRFTSPAMSPDGTSVYVTSTDCKLLSLSAADGSQNWSYDYGSKHGVAYLTSYGGKDARVVTPSVDTDGTIFFAGGYNEPNTAGPTATIMALNADGSLKWSVEDGSKTDFGMFAPVITDNAIMTAQTNGGSFTNDQGGCIINKQTGAKIYEVFARQGSQGGMAAYGEMMFLNAGGTAMGTQVIFPNAESGATNWTAVDKADEKCCPGSGRAARSCQMAVSKDGLLYTIYPRDEDDKTKGGVLFCFEISTFEQAPSTATAAKWTRNIMGELSSDKMGSASAPASTGGHGIAIAPDGTLFVTTATSLTAVDKTGKILWRRDSKYRIDGVPAIDNEGFVYYSDRGGNVYKLASDGQLAASVKIDGAEFSSSVTIANNGKLYLVGTDNGKPTLYCLSTNDITGPADSWSQLAGNPCKTGRVK